MFLVAQGHHPALLTRPDVPRNLAIPHYLSPFRPFALLPVTSHRTFLSISAAAASLVAFSMADVGTAYAQAEVAPGTVEGPGIKVGEGTVIHPVVGIETGVISNVFFEDSDENVSGILRVIAEFAASSMSKQRLATSSGGVADDSVAEAEGETGSANQGSVKWDAGLRLAYEEWLSANDRVQAQRDMAVGFDASALVNPQNTWQFVAEEHFTREIRPANYESPSDVDRDINRIVLGANYQPEGRTLSGTLRFQNTIDVFEGDEHDFANRMLNSLATRANWRIFPFTNLYADASIGANFGLGSVSTKATSFPLRVITGIQTALTVNTTAAAHVGFGKGFYTAGPDFTMALFGGQFGVRHSPLARTTFLYDYGFQDSINANFFRDHQLRVQHEQLIKDFQVTGRAGLVFRSYRGIDPAIMGSSTDRSDIIFDAQASVSRSFRDWLAGSIEYHFITDQTSYMQAGDDPSYTRHELTIGVRGAL